jgi:acetyl esterase/lipase
VRLVLNIILFPGSLLCIFVAPTFRLWIASIVVSEFSGMFLVVAASLLIWGFYGKKFRRTNITLSSLSLILFAIPIATAWYIGQKLPVDIANNLGGTPMSGSVFHFTRMFSRTQMLPYQTFRYTNKDEEDLTLDFYHSTRRGNRPCVVVIHGGSWCGGNSQQLPELNSELARNGFQVASVNYRLAPKYKSPAPIEDIDKALRYLKQHSQELKIDTNNFILLGRSAGAQLALVAAYTLPTDNIKGVINFYGPTDMVWGYEMPVSPYIMDSKKVLEDFLGGPISKVPQQYKASSPVEVVNRRKSIPTLIIHGENDALVAFEHGERLKKKLAANDIPHYMLSLPWATHGCDYTLNGPSGQLTTYAVEYFVNQVVKRRSQNFHLVKSDQAGIKVGTLSEPVAYESSGD